MMSSSQRDQIVAIIDDIDDLTIATVREDGWPQATTVSFVNEGLAIYFGTWIKSQKAQNIARNDKVSITINRPYTTWDDIEGLSIGGRAKLVTDPQEQGRIGQLMFKKFPQIAQYAGTMQGDEMAFVRVDPVVVSLLDYSKGFGHTELFDMR